MGVLAGGVHVLGEDLDLGLQLAELGRRLVAGAVPVHQRLAAAGRLAARVLGVISQVDLDQVVLDLVVGEVHEQGALRAVAPACLEALGRQ